jgi:alkanesulfonate monooxygenase SsuD/methylene tetrahydromethanopterin reductase-like flavin-dependent oxidoreductase (luciferase family)
MKFGVLEFGFNNARGSAETLENFLDRAKIIEKLKFSRIWLGEHYEDGMAWRNPDILVGIVAGLTAKIRVGTAGVLLPLARNLRVAYDYKLLAYLYPDRIDLGVAKGIAPPYIFEKLAIDSRAPRNFDNEIDQLASFVEGSFTDDAGNQHIVPPGQDIKPDIWYLSSSGMSSEVVIRNKLNYSLSLFHRSDSHVVLESFNAFKDLYRQRNGSELRFNIAISGICQSTQKEAEAIRDASQNRNFNINFCGTPEMFDKYIRDLAGKTGVEEIIILSLCNTDKEDRAMLRLISKRISD